LKLLLKAFGGIVATLAAIIELTSPDQVAPFKRDSVEAAAKDRTKSPKTNIYPFFIISQITPHVTKLPYYITIIIK
jgi:hypothetical protein